MHIADWYATFAALAGLDHPTDHAAANAHLPPVDSVDAWPALTRQPSALPYTRRELPLSSNALLDALTGLKFLRGIQRPAGWQGPLYPNASSPHADPNYELDCGSIGCLFNVTHDREEHWSLTSTMPDVAKVMGERLRALSKIFFDNKDKGVDACPAGVVRPGLPCACWMAHNHYRGTLGPWQEIDIGGP